MAAGFSVSGYAVFQSLTPQKIAIGQAKLAKSASVKGDIEYFRAKAAKCKTPDDFLKDYRLLKFALMSYSMEDQLEYPARIKQIMKDDPSDKTALVSRMTASGYKEINADFAFFSKGVKNLQDPKFLDKIVKKYEQSQYEISLGNTNPALTDALYFQRKIGAVTNAYQIIGDPVLFSVVKTALNIPAAAVTGDVKRLKQWIEQKVDMKKLTNAPYIKKLVDRFLVLKDVETRESSGGGLLDIFA